jgi:acyl-coenzyme A thioesterase PaaI-like protein
VTLPSTPRPVDPDLMAAVTDLGATLRVLIENSVTTLVDAPELRRVTEQVTAAAEALAVARCPLTQLPRLDDPAVFRRVYNPVSGIGSPLAPPLVIRRGEGGVFAEVSLGAAYEGPPGYVHGGMSSLLMDQLLGAAAMAAGRWGMTAHLELDYRGPLPLATTLLLRAGVAEESGRKTVITGSVALAETPEQVLVEARGVFVAPRPEQSRAYFGSVTDSSGRHAPPGNPTDATAVAPE